MADQDQASLRCPTCGKAVSTTISFGQGPPLPFCVKRKCAAARLRVVKQVAKAMRGTR